MATNSSQGLKKDQRAFAKDIDFLADSIERMPLCNERRMLMNYRDKTLPFFVPRYFVQSRLIPERRKCNLIGGFPYTSNEYPWLFDGAYEQYLQPIVQVDLEYVGSLLKDDFGTGLLQVWGYDAQNHGLLQAELRIVPKEALSEPADSFFPSEIACAMELGDRINARPQVRWVYAADMFMGTMEYVSSVRDDSFANVPSVHAVNPANEKADEPNGNDAQSNEFDLDFADIRLSLMNVPYFGTYLGGYGGDYGSRGSFLNVNPEKGRLLVRIYSDLDDSNLGVIVRENVEGSPTFEIECCYV